MTFSAIVTAIDVSSITQNTLILADRSLLYDLVVIRSAAGVVLFGPSIYTYCATSFFFWWVAYSSIMMVFITALRNFHLLFPLVMHS